MGPARFLFSEQPGWHAEPVSVPRPPNPTADNENANWCCLSNGAKPRRNAHSSLESYQPNRDLGMQRAARQRAGKHHHDQNPTYSVFILYLGKLTTAFDCSSILW